MITPRRGRWVVRVIASLTLLASSSDAFAQFVRYAPRPATAAEVVGGNILLGGLTAATRAIIGGRDPWKAFSIGAFGGAVHIAGKHLAVEPGAPNGLLGLVVSSTGTSIVSNAGRGVSPLREVSIPIASVRLRVTPKEPRKLRFVVNGYESALVISAFLTDGLAIDWTRTVSSGAAVFETRGSRIKSDEREVGGLAWGPVALIDPLSFDPDRTVRHELTHVHQHWFVAEAWARPIEEYLRSRIRGGRFIPSWLELGIQDAVWYLDGQLFGRAGLYALIQAEAERLERR